MHNDIAITYYHLGDYEKCIDECKTVLQMGDVSAYVAANYNAAQAYEKQGKSDKAIKNYQAGIRHGGNVKTFKSKINKLNSKPMYQSKRNASQRRV